jgi:hypothetical protein
MSLYVSNNAKLKKLNISRNPLKKLVVPKSNCLTGLDYEDNQLAGLSVSVKDAGASKT